MASVLVNPPKSPVTKGSNGIAAATVPNVCKMPGPPAPFVPAPLPNIGKSGKNPQGYSQDVTIEGKAVAIKGATFESMGDIASKGTGGGMVSANCEGITKFVGPGSMDVKIEGGNVQLLTDPMLNNCAAGGSPPNAATMQGIVQEGGPVTAVGPRVCPLCGRTDHDPLAESPETNADAAQLAQEYEPREAQEAADAQAAWDEDPLPPGGPGQVRPKRKGGGRHKGLRPERRSTMLGVVHCKTDQKYADKSGPTNFPLNSAGAALGMDTWPTDTNQQTVGQRMRDMMGNTDAFQATWTLAEEYFAESQEEEALATAYPPGSCAAQGAIVLCLYRQGLPKAMTERWYSPPDQNRPTRERIRFILVSKTGARSMEEEQFAPGATVPPCATCVRLLPWLLCFTQEETCGH